MSRPTDPFDPDPEVTRDEGDEDVFARREERNRAGVGVSDFVRKAIEGAVGSVQSTGSASKDAISYVFEQGEKGRKEVLRIVASEVGNFLRETDLSHEVTRILTSVKVDFNATLRFTPAEDGRSVETDIGEPEVRVDLGSDDEDEEPEVARESRAPGPADDD